MKEMITQERPDINKMIEVEQRRQKLGHMERVKTDVRAHMSTEAIVKHVHFMS